MKWSYIATLIATLIYASTLVLQGSHDNHGEVQCKPQQQCLLVALH